METDLGLWVFKCELNLIHMNEFETQIKKDKKEIKNELDMNLWYGLSSSSFVKENVNGIFLKKKIDGLQSSYW